MATKIERLQFTRKKLVRSITLQTTAIEAFTNETPAAVQISRKEALEMYWVDFRDNADAIENTRDWAGTDEYLNEFEETHEKYLAALVKLLETMPEQVDVLQNSLETARGTQVHRQFNEESLNGPTENNADAIAQSTPHARGTIGLPTNVKLAPLTIKPFGGEVVDWPEFKATCESTFASIPDEVNRFRYLKGHLSEEPYRLIKHLPLVPGSYNQAIELLKKRYDNERAIINANLKRFMALPKLVTESTEGLKQMLDTTNECIAAINGYQISTDSWSCILVFLLTQRLDPESVKHWEEKLQGQRTVPAFTEFTEFLETRINVLENSSANGLNNAPKKTKTFVNVENTRKCNLCREHTHYTYACPQLTATVPAERERFVLEKGLCINCLHFHKVESCTSRFSCRYCKQRHNTALHVPEQVHHLNTSDEITSLIEANPDLDPDVIQAIEMSGQFFAHLTDETKQSRALLATAVVQIEHDNRFLHAKSLIDQGSTGNLVTERLCRALDLPMERMNMPIIGVCDTVTYKVRYRATFTLVSKINPDYAIKISALVVPKITTLNQRLSLKLWPHFKGLPLADPHMDDANRIDVLLGSTVHGEIIDNGLIKGQSGQPIAQKTKLGWIVSGGGNQLTGKTPIFTMQITNDSLTECLTKFWESEEMPTKTFFTKEEQLAEEIFVKTTKRCEDGRLMVKLPFKNNGGPILGQSFAIAKRRYDYMRKRFVNKPQLGQKYDQCIQQYLDLNHMELSNVEQWPHNYLPHHPVIKESSSTTKIRPVYDASCKTDNGNSLNSQLLVGPTIQSDLTSLLIHWRKGKIAILGDIEQMYRQVWVYPEDREYQRILWRPPGSDETKSYRLKTVTFGVASAPFLAIRSLFQIADDIAMECPELATKIKTQFYVDDYVDSLDTVEEARQVIQQITDALAKYGFTLKKWKSNDEKSMVGLQESQIECNTTNIFKTLGIQWDQKTDEFLFIPAELKESCPVSTKRIILSDISKLFDPLGWLSPCIILAKIFMQQLWLLQLDWDDPLPTHIVDEWRAIQSQFMTSCAVRIPRWIGYNKDAAHISLQGFSDASEKACAAVVYIRIVCLDGSISCRLIASKTKVAPLKKLSIPRLELKAAVLLAQLMSTVRHAIRISNVQVHTWTDSTIVLHWLAGHPSRWKTFIANRVAMIHELLPSHVWRHIESGKNPADCASRGLNRHDLEKHNMWWYGPEFLIQTMDQWPVQEGITLESVPEERIHVTVTVDQSLITHFSTYNLMINSMAICLRWSLHNKFNGTLCPQEIMNAEKRLIKYVQAEMFATELKCLQNNQPLFKTSTILKLDPFIDEEGVIRVGGRIHLANLSEDEKHPIILSPKHHFTKLLIEHMHKEVKHGGSGLTLQKIRQMYWIIGAKTAVSSAIYRCIKCFRFRKELLTQKMGNLPAYRVRQGTFPFQFTGIDYAGYFWVKSSQRKNAPYLKAYIALFVCLTTRAVHLELVSDCSTEQFLKAFQRFIGRRGMPNYMFSDNATNFVGAAREIQESLDQAMKESNSALRAELLKCRIEWSHIPPRAQDFNSQTH